MNQVTSSKATSKSHFKDLFKLKPVNWLPMYQREAYPDFLPSPVFYFRDKIREKLERQDMMNRRKNIIIPEFYVGMFVYFICWCFYASLGFTPKGSVLAVNASDPYAPEKLNRFVGICIRRDSNGLRHMFTLRNVVDGTGKTLQPCWWIIIHSIIAKIYLQIKSGKLDTFSYEKTNLGYPIHQNSQRKNRLKKLQKPKHFPVWVEPQTNFPDFLNKNLCKYSRCQIKWHKVSWWSSS